MDKIIEALKNINTSETQIDIEYLRLCGDNCNYISAYIYQNTTVYNMIEGRYLVLQNGLDFIANNYDLPCNTLELSSHGGCDTLFYDVYDLGLSEIEALGDEEFEELRQKHGFKSKEQVLELYLALWDAISTLSRTFTPRPDVDDFDISTDDETGETVISEKYLK